MLNISLAELLSGLISIPPDANHLITGLTLDSRQVNPGYLFVACPGCHDDGRYYINEALAHDAGAIIYEADGREVFQLKNNIPYLSVKNLRQHVGEIAAKFYGYPSKKIGMVGITGTNGKTSCSHYIAKILHETLHPCAVIGTLGSGLFGELTHSRLTTPDAITIQKLLAQFYSQGAKTVIMEASSHALAQGRVKDIDFNLGVFTNLSHDHLDYHKSMQNYAASKASLFTNYNLQHAIVNIDDKFGRKIYSQLPAGTEGFSYAIENNQADIFADNVHISWSGIRASVRTPWGKGILETRLTGKYNLLNVLATLATLNMLGMNFYVSLSKLKSLQNIQGRMQTIKFPGKPTVIIDYAHTPNALSNILQNLRLFYAGKIWCVFGCGGDRDKYKRASMGKIAEKFADEIILTNDNPRHEDPKNIVDDILRGISTLNCVPVILDRRQAIEYALQRASEDDIVLIAGKGHETYQIVGNTKLPFCDFTIVNEILEIPNSKRIA